MNVRSPPFLPPCPTYGRYKERDSPLQQCAQCVQHTSFPCAGPTSQCGPRHVQRDQHRGRQRRGRTSLHPRVAETRRCQCSTGVLRPTTNNNASGAANTEISGEPPSWRVARPLHPTGSAAPFTSPRPSYPRALHYRIADTDKDVCACGTLGNERKDHPDGGNTRSWDDTRRTPSSSRPAAARPRTGWSACGTARPGRRTRDSGVPRVLGPNRRSPSARCCRAPPGHARGTGWPSRIEALEVERGDVAGHHQGRSGGRRPGRVAAPPRRAGSAARRAAISATSGDGAESRCRPAGPHRPGASRRSRWRGRPGTPLVCWTSPL